MGLQDGIINVLSDECRLEIKGDTLVVYLLVCLAVDSYILRVLGIEGVGLGTYLDVFQASHHRYG